MSYIEAGRLSERIIIRKPKSTKNSVGENIAVWYDYKAVWANISQMSGRKLIESDRELSESILTITVRYNDNITIGDRISWHG